MSDQPENEVVVFSSQGGEVRFAVSEDGETIWGTRSEIARAFGCTERNVNIHIQNIYDDGELPSDSTRKESFLVQNEGGRQVKRPVELLNLDVILSIGYRVSSQRATAFRQWATRTLKRYITGGYVLNAERLKNDPAALRSLSDAIRAIRLEEKVMYAKVRDVFATSATDYDGNSQTAKSFFAMAQDKFLYAITEKTAAQLILERANANKLNMGLQCVKGDQPTADEAKTGKNYLTAEEMKGLENICEQFLLFAESKAFRGQTMTMEELTTKLNILLQANDYKVLYKYESYQRKQAETHARIELERYRARIVGGRPVKQIDAAKKKR